MDFIESLGKQLSEISAYDVKSYYDKAKNMVMNYTEMEAKVREATNDDAWGASSSLMQEIAQGTFNFQLFNEIMPVIYKRFTEKEAREWRQIYKALQLLEYLVKHGSERVVDDARSHLSMIKMLRNFHYVDEKGKDQGINVRNRSKELSELLQDLDRVRQERKKAKQNKNKYTGVSSDGYRGGGFSGNPSPSFNSPSGSRYGGFGSDSLHGGSSMGTGSSYPTSYPSSARSTRRDSFDEYDAGDDEVRTGTRSKTPDVPAPIQKDTPRVPQGKTKEINLFDFDDDDNMPSGNGSASTSVPAPSAAIGKLSLDDDFDDFQSAGAAETPAPAPVQAKQTTQPGGLNFFDMMAPSSQSSHPANVQTLPQPQLRTTHNMPAGPNYATAGNNALGRPGMGSQSTSFAPMKPSASSSSVPKMATTAIADKPKAGAFDFDDLFAASGAKKATSASTGSSGNTIASLAQQKQNNSLWGNTGSASAGTGQSRNTNNDDLLF